MAKRTVSTAGAEAPETLDGHIFYGLTLDPEQERFRDAIWDREHLIVFCNARAGSGKTLVATAAAYLLCEYDRYSGVVYIAAPTQEQKQGFLKGSIEEKSEPYFEPFYEALEKIGVTRSAAQNGKYQAVKTECVTHTFLRGTNFEDKVVIIDEAQNFRTDELKKVLTRIHDDCKVIVIGHDGQTDIDEKTSGFLRYLEWFRRDERTAVCELTENHRGWISSHADAL